jgi:hypothetical protein
MESLVNSLAQAWLDIQHEVDPGLIEEGLREVGLAIRRILLINGMILVAGGIPLIYLGDEIAMLNDYTYRDDPAHERHSH